MEITKLEKSAIEIKSSISVAELNKYREKALKKLGTEIVVDGFRKGHIPENILIGKIGEINLTNEMAEMALSDLYPAIILKNKINTIGRPQISITKMAPGNPVEFKITTTVLPQFTLPDYKTIAKKINGEKQKKIEVTDKDLEDAIQQILKQQSQPVEVQPPQVDETNSETDKTDGTTELPKLPKLTDEFVKKIGNFKDVADFKTKLRENITKEKELRAQEAHKAKIMDNILAETKIELPEIIIADETDRIIDQIKNNISQMGLIFDKYLEHIKKTEKDLRKEFSPEAEKRAKIQLILDKIIKDEKIKPNETEVKKNVEQLLAQHKDAPEEKVRSYVEMVLSNQEVFKLLGKEV